MSRDTRLAWQGPTGDIVAAHVDVAEQLRRRRDAAARGEIPTVRIGKKIRVPVAQLLRQLGYEI